MEVMHPDICPNCGVQLVPHDNNIKAFDEIEVKRLISENGPLSKITEGVYKKDNCPHYYYLLKTKDIKADILIICFGYAVQSLPLYEAVFNKWSCKLSVIATYCIGVMIE